MHSGKRRDCHRDGTEPCNLYNCELSLVIHAMPLLGLIGFPVSIRGPTVRQ